MTKERRWITADLLLLCLFFVVLVFVLPHPLTAQELQTGSSILATRVAPGESLPLTIRLSNFGSSERVDVTIRYEIFDSTESLVVSQTETVAVETSASYIKQILLPPFISPGLYMARISIIYDGQHVPATASQQFSVERKIYGIFMSDLIRNIFILCVVALLCILLGLLLRRYRKESLFAPHDYSDIPKDVRVFYEILSDVVQQMRYHDGERAVEVAAKIPGLTLDSTSGRVLTITRDPSQVIAEVVSQYEKAFGKKLNLAFGGKEKGHAIVR